MAMARNIDAPCSPPPHFRLSPTPLLSLSPHIDLFTSFPVIHQTAITPLPFPPPFLPPFLPPFPPSLSPSFPPLLFPPPFPPALPPLSFPFSFPPVRVQSDGVTKMIPGDEKRHWRLAGLEYLRELQVLSSLVCVLSRRCKDPRMHRLKQRLAELEAQGEAHLREREAQEGGERESGGSEGDAREGDAREGGIGRLQGQQGDGGAQGGGMAQGSGRGKEMMVVGRGWDGGGGWEGKGNVNVNVNGSGGGGGGGGGGDASEEDWFLYSPKEEAFLRKFLEKKVTATNRLHVEMTLLDNLMPSPLSPIFKPLPPIFNPLPPFFNPPSPPLSLPSSSHSLRMARFTKDAPSWATTAIAASPFVREKIQSQHLLMLSVSNLRSLLYPNPPLPPLPPSFPPSPLFPPFPPLSPLPPLFPPFPPLSPLPPSFPPSPLFPPLPPSSPTSPPPTLLLFPLPSSSSSSADPFSLSPQLQGVLTLPNHDSLLAAAVAILSYKVRSTFKWQRGGGSSGTGGAAAEDEREGVAGTVGEAGLSIRYAHTLQILERILNKPTLLLRAQRDNLYRHLPSTVKHKMHEQAPFGIPSAFLFSSDPPPLLPPAPHLFHTPRDDLYRHLPSTVKHKVRRRLSNRSRPFDVEVAAEMRRSTEQMLAWVLPMAQRTLAWQAEHSYGCHLSKRQRSLHIQVGVIVVHCGAEVQIGRGRR
ncbi:unnamed protein product [Closterium sp. NIES-64]|nr:unnamed protein product [Closterium sp. NIES-64]